MRVHPATISSVALRLAKAIGCASFVFGMAAPAFAAAPYEVNLASPSQALAFCQSGAMPSSDIAYISSSTGAVQYGPADNCKQKKATKKLTKTVADGLLVDGSGTVKECKLANATSAVSLCNAGGVGTYDIAYILGGLYKTVGGPGYGCDIVKHVGNIGNAICK